MCFQVFSKGPDDKVYNANKDLREKVARGNSVLYINDLESKTIEQDCIIFALRKFTGGTHTPPKNVWAGLFFGNQGNLKKFLEPAMFCHLAVLI